MNTHTHPLRVYLAGPYQARDQIAAYATDLVRLGLTVTARWLSENHDITPGTVGPAVDLTDDAVAQHALDDFTDINRSDVLVLITADLVNSGNSTSGGRHVETGYALARGIPILVVGRPENVFHRLGTVYRPSDAEADDAEPVYDVQIVGDWHGAIIDLGARALKRAGASTPWVAIDGPVATR